MDGEIPAPVTVGRFDQATLDRKAKTAVDSPHLAAPSKVAASEVTALNSDSSPCSSSQPLEIFDRVNQLNGKAKVALICNLIGQLKTDQVEAVLEFGQRELADRQRDAATIAVSESRVTSLLLKKDYTYQDRGLSEPMQYYVYLRRRKPKLDRYIGTLFYIPQGCTLSYFHDSGGRIFFKPPHNVFQLKDSKNSLATQIVRLICLEPPPSDYTFTKQQDDVPEIHLRLEYLDAKFQPLTEASYPFPSCMYEGGKLDRYRWEVSTTLISSEVASPEHEDFKPDATQPEVSQSLPKTFGEQISPDALGDAANADEIASTSSPEGASIHKPEGESAKSLRRIIELPPPSATFYLANSSDSAAVLERIRLWVSWSEKAMPQSRWEIVQSGGLYTLRNVSFKRKILSISPEQAAVTLESSLPVFVKWFQDLGLAVSQAQNQRHYTSAQLKLARSLFVEMSLPQDNAIAMLKKLFGVKFVKTGK